MINISPSNVFMKTFEGEMLITSRAYINCSGGKSRCFAWGARCCKNRACCSVVVGIRAPKLMAGARIQGCKLNISKIVRPLLAALSVHGFNNAGRRVGQQSARPLSYWLDCFLEC